MVGNYKKKGTRGGDVDEQLSMKFWKTNSLYGNQQPKLDLMYKHKQSCIKKYAKHKIQVAKIVYLNPNLHHSMFFAKTEEDLLNKYILRCSKMHYGLTWIQVKKLSYEFAKTNDIKHPASWNNNKMADADWLASFRK